MGLKSLRLRNDIKILEKIKSLNKIIKKKMAGINPGGNKFE